MFGCEPFTKFQRTWKNSGHCRDGYSGIIHGHRIHLPDDLLARLGTCAMNFCCSKEFVEVWQRMLLIPAPSSRRAARRGQWGRRNPSQPPEATSGSSRDLIGTELGKEHALKFNVDVDLLQHLLHDLPILTREFKIGGALDLDLCSSRFCLSPSRTRPGVPCHGQCAWPCRPVADQLRTRFRGHGPRAEWIVSCPHRIGFPTRQTLHAACSTDPASTPAGHRRAGWMSQC